MMAFNPIFAGSAQMPTPIKGTEEGNSEALRLLASGNFLGGMPPMVPQIEAVRAMLPSSFPFPLVYPGHPLPQEFKPELFSNGGGPIPPFLVEGFGFHPYGGIDGARRKNATRETTAPLKEWLTAHRTNPYPTKGEKIYLAVMTKMTLTQVSTWFANARRRLKKENGGNVSINKKDRDGDDDDDDLADIDRPSSSTSNVSDGSYKGKEDDADSIEPNENVKHEMFKGGLKLCKAKKSMLSIDNILGVKDAKKDEEASSSKKDSPSSASDDAMGNMAFFQRMFAMYTQNPQFMAAAMAGRPGAAPFFPFNPLMMSAAMVPTTPTGAANGSFTSEATSVSPSSSHSPVAASKESSPLPKTD